LTNAKALKQLTLRSLAGTATSIAGIIAIKKFSLVLYATAQNISPVVTVVLGYFLINDKIKLEDVALLAVVLLALFVKFIPEIFPDAPHFLPREAKDPAKAGAPVAPAPTVVDYLLLLYIPLGIALSNILLRKMKGLHFIQLSVYKILYALAIAGAIVLIQGTSIQPVKNFTTVDWLILVGGSLV
jgi:hypothetical protein